jgi:hypothetical protein
MYFTFTYVGRQEVSSSPTQAAFKNFLGLPSAANPLHEFDRNFVFERLGIDRHAKDHQAVSARVGRSVAIMREQITRAVPPFFNRRLFF